MKPSRTQQLLESFVRQTVEQVKIATILQHPGETGRAREQALTALFRSFLPPSLGITTGFVIDALGGMSKQMDIVIHFADYHAVFKVNEIPLVPVEAVIAVIEVKSDVSGGAVLVDSYDKLASCKILDRSAGGQNALLNDKQRIELDPEDWRLFDLQVFGAVIAMESPTQNFWLRTTAEWCDGKARSLWPNLYCGVHDGYIGTYHARPNGPDQEPLVSWPRPEAALNFATVLPRDESALAWAVQELLNFVRVARRIDYSPAAYLSAATTPADEVSTHPLPAGS